MRLVLLTSLLLCYSQDSDKKSPFTVCALPFRCVSIYKGRGQRRIETISSNLRYVVLDDYRLYLEITAAVRS
jgi:hypothetical protein